MTEEKEGSGGLRTILEDGWITTALNFNVYEFWSDFHRYLQNLIRDGEFSSEDCLVEKHSISDKILR